MSAHGDFAVGESGIGNAGNDHASTHRIAEVDALARFASTHGEKHGASLIDRFLKELNDLAELRVGHFALFAIDGLHAAQTVELALLLPGRVAFVEVAVGREEDDDISGNGGEKEQDRVDDFFFENRVLSRSVVSYKKEKSNW